MFADEPEDEPLERVIIREFAEQLKARGIPHHGQHQMTLFVDAIETGTSIVLSVSAMVP